MNVAVIGAGGIGSYLCPLLKKLMKNDQLPFKNFSLFDFDIVEHDNIKHQNFEKEDAGIPKALVMELKGYCKGANLHKFDKNDLDKFDLFIICADNAYVRNLIYEHVNIHKDKKFIDLRATGDIIAVYTQKVSLQELQESLGTNPESKETFSCQTAQDKSANKIQMGNFVVAPLGLQVLLNMVRGVRYPAKQVLALT